MVRRFVLLLLSLSLYRPIMFPILTLFYSLTRCDCDPPRHLQEMLEVLRMIPSPVYAVNTVLTEKRELSFITFGDIEESHLKSVEYAQSYSVIESPQKYKTVVTCSAGFPLDQSYYQVRNGVCCGQPSAINRKSIECRYVCCSSGDRLSKAWYQCWIS